MRCKKIALPLKGIIFFVCGNQNGLTKASRNHSFILNRLDKSGMSEYSNIFGYSNIFLRILNIRIRILKFCLTNIFEYSRFFLRIFTNILVSKILYIDNFYAFKTTTYIFLNFLLKQFLQMIQLNQDLIRSSKTGCGLDSPGIPYCRLYLTRVKLSVAVCTSFISISWFKDLAYLCPQKSYRLLMLILRFQEKMCNYLKL